MKWMGLNKIREEILSFFEEKGHKRLNSFPLIPQDDKSLLLINSGMAPMKKWFLGQETPPNNRVTTCQKCIRTPDIERVGKTSRHGTFFEMLGNFSFGDYFKEEATTWAWEFVTKKLELPIDKIWVSIYQDDDEAYEIWTKHRGVDPSHIVRLGKEDNFWEIGSGPCGPCSELYFDRGEDKGCGRKDCGVGCDCDRFVEFWNLVFSQYNSDGNGNYTPMTHPNIDTGLGLERLACILQGVDNLFEVDTIHNIIEKITNIAKVEYGKDEHTDVSIRIITDHIRSIVFLIGDGVIPGNEGREYVLRRLIRRAARNGKFLGINHLFLAEIAQTVIIENRDAYPELGENEDYIKKIIQAEEESFYRIIDRGMNMLNEMIDYFDSQLGQSKTIPGEDIFKLCDTYGFPFDMVQEIAQERNIGIDEDGFSRLMKEQKARARTAARSSTIAWNDDNLQINAPITEFVGYDCFSCESTLLELFVDGKSEEKAGENQNVELIFDRTPFYAQSGGQIGDRGVFSHQNLVVKIIDCQKAPSGHFVHKGVILTGTLCVGMNGKLTIDEQSRWSIARNHTAAHLLQKTLQQVLGTHVHQAGQLVDDARLRFDFNHFAALTTEELQKVEALVNEKILSSLPVSIYETDIESARKKGAMALFGEKYGEIVRVVDIGGFSIELCGGCHVDSTAKLGLFKILSETSASAGTRRIEATTGTGVLNFMSNMQNLVSATAGALKVQNVAEMPTRCKAMQKELREKDKKIEQLNRQAATAKLKNLVDASNLSVCGIKLISASLNGTDVPSLREMGDRIKANEEPMIAVFAGIVEGKGTLLAVATPSAVKMGAHAGMIVKQVAALAGGKGGGRPDSAMAGVNQIFQIDEALAQLPIIVQNLME